MKLHHLAFGIIAAVVVLLVVVTVDEANDPKQGVVTKKIYKPPYSSSVPYKVGEYTHYRTTHHPARYLLWLQDGDNEGDREVAPEVWNKVEVGDWINTTTMEIVKGGGE